MQHTGDQNVEGSRERRRRYGGKIDADRSCAVNGDSIVHRRGGNEGGNGSSDDSDGSGCIGGVGDKCSVE